MVNRTKSIIKWKQSMHKFPNMLSKYQEQKIVKLSWENIDEDTYIQYLQFV